MNRFLAVSAAAALVCGTVACGGGGGVTGATPTATDYVGAPAGTVATGATLRGRVETGSPGAAATEGVRALAAAAGVKITIVGSPLATTTDASGEFALRGVPEGRLQLRFEASGIDARLDIDGPAAGQSLNVNVHLSSSGAFLAETEDHRNETTLRGRVDAVAGNRLTVLGRTVVTDALTRFLGRGDAPASLADVRAGQLVEVEGTGQADGTLYARKVKLEDASEAESPESEVNFVGTVQGVSPLVVSGRRVDTDGATRVLDRRNTPIAVSALKSGDRVEVEGTARGDGSVLAKKIKLQD